MAGAWSLERDQTDGMFRARQLDKVAHLAMFPSTCSDAKIMCFDSQSNAAALPYKVVLLFARIFIVLLSI